MSASFTHSRVVVSVRGVTHTHLCTGEAMPAHVLDDRAITTRVRVLAEIADRYTELVDPMNGPSGERGTGEQTPHMPATYTPTVREFERLAVKLRASQPSLYWHLSHWHLRAVRAQKWLPRAVKRRNQHTEWKLEPRIVCYRHPDASQDKAKQALEWVARQWTLGTEPMLPAQLPTPGHTQAARSTTPASHQSV